MAIPDYQSIMLPLLKHLADKKEHSNRDVIESLAKTFNLSDEEQKELLPSGRQPIFDNRVGWAHIYLKKAGLIESTKRGCYRIADRGLDVLKQNLPEINVKFLEQYPEFIEFREGAAKTKDEQVSTQTPEESLEQIYQKIKQQLAQDLLKRVKESTPGLFERLVVELLVKMGYGGSRRDAEQAIGKSSDGGIDGFIKEDRLGLDIVYIQAKRWEGVVGRPEIYKFVGALQGQRAKKGVFITTSSFTRDAIDYVSRIDIRIVLVDGDQLAQLMIDNNIGVSPIASYEIKRIDSDYFAEE